MMQITRDTPGKRKFAAKKLKSANLDEKDIEYRIYVQFPEESDHSGHLMGEAS